MSALDLAQISACLRTLSRHRLTVTDLPTPVLGLILSFCDTRTRQSAALAARCFYRALAEIPEQVQSVRCQNNFNTLIVYICGRNDK